MLTVSKESVAKSNRNSCFGRPAAKLGMRSREGEKKMRKEIYTRRNTSTHTLCRRASFPPKFDLKTIKLGVNESVTLSCSLSIPILCCLLCDSLSRHLPFAVPPFGGDRANGKSSRRVAITHSYLRLGFVCFDFYYSPVFRYNFLFFFC